MSLNITIHGPGHYFWCSPRVWFHRPDEHATGIAGFRVPFLQVNLVFGRRA